MNRSASGSAACTPRTSRGAQLLPLLEDEPALLVTPLLRSGNLLAVGWNEPQ